MIHPKRLQLQRKKGFNLQQYSKSLNGLECLVVSRPNKWGNPFKLVGGDMVYLNASHRRTHEPWIFVCMGTAKDCIRFYKMVVTGVMDGNYSELLKDNISDLLYWVEHFSKLDLADLADKNLSCWCPLHCQCHADVLIKLANEPNTPYF